MLCVGTNMITLLTMSCVAGCYSEREREAMQATMAEKDKEMTELEERTTALVEAQRAQNDASNWATYELFVVSFYFMLFQIFHFNVRFINK